MKVKNSKGFTIIELIIVIGLITILPTVVISNFSQIKMQFALSRTVYKFAQDLRVAQDLALSSKPYTDSFGQSQPVAGYGIYLDARMANQLGNKKYITYADKEEAGFSDSQYTLSDYIVSEFDISLQEPGIIIKETNNPSGNFASINFSPPNPSTTITSLPQNQNALEVIFAVESDLNNTRKVIINTTGLVEVE